MRLWVFSDEMLVMMLKDVRRVSDDDRLSNDDPEEKAAREEAEAIVAEIQAEWRKRHSEVQLNADGTFSVVQSGTA